MTVQPIRNQKRQRPVGMPLSPPAVAALVLLMLAGLVLLAGAHSDPAGAKKKKKNNPRRLIASDTAGNASPIPFWRKIDCADDSRHQFMSGGGDPSATAMGSPQGNASYRQLTVFDGDDQFGERCELGWNSNTSPVAFYREGKRRITYASLRLPGNFALSTSGWQNVLQMKQSWPADNSSGEPALSLTANRNRWEVWRSPPGDTGGQNLLWARPARAGVWTRFAIDARYSRSKSKGWIRVLADLNGDGDFGDGRERSRTIHTSTLKAEIPGTPSDGYVEGQSLPSHLRAGIYHDPAIPCPGPVGCSIDIDNVQVVAP